MAVEDLPSASASSQPLRPFEIENMVCEDDRRPSQADLLSLASAAIASAHPMQIETLTIATFGGAPLRPHIDTANCASLPELIAVHRPDQGTRILYVHNNKKKKSTKKRVAERRGRKRAKLCQTRQNQWTKVGIIFGRKR